MTSLSRSLSRYIVIIWVVNCLLVCAIAVREVWVPYMSAVWNNYAKIVSYPFDGTSMPILYIPDWTKSSNQEKSKRFEDIPMSEFLPIPLYDPLALLDAKNPSKATTNIRYTYITPFMGTYTHDYLEYSGGHPGVDIRAPIGTPVLSIANGVAVRVVNGDATGNKFVVIRHDDVPVDGVRKTLYSGYLHLSEMLVREGDVVRKWDMIGRVGMSGLATTPHLHFQIDTAEAPFHPYWHFTSSEAKAAWVWFYEAVNTGLGKDKALRYTIHPMSLVNMYLWWITPSRSNETKIPTADRSISADLILPDSIRSIASYIWWDESCIGKRFSDVSEKSTFGWVLYPLVDKKCLFMERSGNFGPKEMITYREALMNIFRYFDIAPLSGNSRFLDIAIGDEFQWYALIAERKWILEGAYAYPEHIMTKEEVATLIVKIAGSEKNPSQLKIYNDVDLMNPNYPVIQDYGFLTRARWGRFYPKTLVSRWVLIQMLANIKK